MTKNLKYTKGAWYHMDTNGQLKPINYEKEIQKYYRNWNRFLKLIEVKK